MPVNVQYPSISKKTREIVLKKHNGACACCGNLKYPVAHHILPAWLNPAQEKQNEKDFILLCNGTTRFFAAGCHKRTETKTFELLSAGSPALREIYAIQRYFYYRSLSRARNWEKYGAYVQNEIPSPKQFKYQERMTGY